MGLTSPHWTGPMGCPRREVVFGPPPPPPRPPNNFVTIESELIFYCGTSKNRKNVQKNAILANISGRKTPHCRYIWKGKKKKKLISKVAEGVLTPDCVAWSLESCRTAMSRPEGDAFCIKLCAVWSTLRRPYLFLSAAPARLSAGHARELKRY